MLLYLSGLPENIKMYILFVCPGLNYYFCNPPVNCYKAKHQLPLVSRFQRAIIYHQRTKIGKVITV